jgi:hypothetical protein
VDGTYRLRNSFLIAIIDNILVVDASAVELGEAWLEVGANKRFVTVLHSRFAFDNFHI